ncbi:hypothetical protein E2C01_025531 [Portunus trituberculatus]|uniref:Uncharacterized protein n=1 Tax=Portunus trituberculatus TaxID=210409 RepID=A0A5B7EGP4_PORTR|nr:hypothetical protein [Portunus trituberculatus]
MWSVNSARYTVRPLMATRVEQTRSTELYSGTDTDKWFRVASVAWSEEEPTCVSANLTHDKTAAPDKHSMLEVTCVEPWEHSTHNAARSAAHTTTDYRRDKQSVTSTEFTKQDAGTKMQVLGGRVNTVPSYYRVREGHLPAPRGISPPSTPHHHIPSPAPTIACSPGGGAELARWRHAKKNIVMYLVM